MSFQQVPLEIVDVETTGYVLRLCPFESLSFSGASITEDDLVAFVEVNMTDVMNYDLLVYYFVAFLILQCTSFTDCITPQYLDNHL